MTDGPVSMPLTALRAREMSEGLVLSGFPWGIWSWASARASCAAYPQGMASERQASTACAGCLTLAFRLGFPLEMLAAIERDHLSGDRRRIEQEAHGAASLLDRSATAKRCRPTFALEVGLAGSAVRQHGAWADGVDADAGGQGLGQRLRCRPQRRLGDGVGEEIGGEPPDALVDHVDHASRVILGQGAREGLGEKNRRAQIDVKLDLPTRPVEGLDRIRFEPGGVVDETARRRKRLGASLYKPAKLILSCEVGLERHGPRSKTLDIIDEFCGVSRGTLIVHANSPAAARQIECDGAPKAKRGSGHKRGTRALLFGHRTGVWADKLAAIRRLYFQVALGHPTNLAYRKLFPSRAPNRGALFCAGADVIPSHNGQTAETEPQRARCFGDCGGARRLHAVHAFFLRPPGPRTLQSLRLAVSLRAAARPLSEQPFQSPP